MQKKIIYNKTEETSIKKDTEELKTDKTPLQKLIEKSKKDFEDKLIIKITGELENARQDKKGFDSQNIFMKSISNEPDYTKQIEAIKNEFPKLLMESTNRNIPAAQPPETPKMESLLEDKKGQLPKFSNVLKTITSIYNEIKTWVPRIIEAIMTETSALSTRTRPTDTSQPTNTRKMTNISPNNKNKKPKVELLRPTPTPMRKPNIGQHQGR